MERPSMIEGEWEEHANRVETDDEGEYFSTVNVICFGEAMSNQTSLVMRNGTIKMIFEREDLLSHDNVSIYQTGN